MTKEEARVLLEILRKDEREPPEIDWNGRRRRIYEILRASLRER